MLCQDISGCFLLVSDSVDRESFINSSMWTPLSSQPQRLFG